MFDFPEFYSSKQNKTVQNGFSGGYYCLNSTTISQFVKRKGGEVMRNKKLVDLRGARTQLDIATDLKISVSALSQYENGKRFPTPEIAKKIAKYFGSTVDELFYGNSFTQCETENPEADQHSLQYGGDAR